MEAMESNLFHSPFYKSKSDRLNLECSDSFLQQNCVPGQKWRCVNENGRWRKHKCKFLTQLQSHMDAISQFTAQSKRNCACFTKKGVIYTKIKSDNKDPNSVLRHKRSQKQFQEFAKNVKTLKEINTIFQRRKRSLEDFIHLPHANVYKEILNVAMKLNKAKPELRVKRDAGLTMIDDIQRELETIESKYRNNQLLLANASGTGEVAKCYVRSDGQVSCSNIIYENEAAWRRSTEEIGVLIEVLKTKIDDLKNIKKHLRENKPQGIAFDYDFDGLSSTKDYTELKKDRSISTTAVEGLLGVIEESRHRHKVNVGQRASNGKHRQRPSSATQQLEKSTTPLAELESSGGSTSWDDDYHLPVSMAVTTQKTKDFNEDTVSVGATIFEPQRNRKPVTTISSSIFFDKNLPNDTSLVESPEDLFSDLNVNVKQVKQEPTECYCEPEKNVDFPNEKELVRQTRRRLKEQRQRKKERKRRRQNKLEGSCIFEKMNCFHHDADHWKTPPLWTDGAFCFCMNANNNTYSCVRTINETHNFLYCEFTTGLVTFYNLRIGL